MYKFFIIVYVSICVYIDKTEFSIYSQKTVITLSLVARSQLCLT